jgi:uncharacterized protein YdhG (YjbR/CyaY superfamily)
MTPKTTPTPNVASYIAGFEPSVQKILKKIRATIKKAAPDAEETIKYQMPTYVLNGNLVFFAAFKQHIGLYPRARGSAALAAQLAPYAGAKGSYRFALDEAVPYELIAEFVRARVREQLTSKPAAKKKAAKKKTAARGGKVTSR